MKKFLIVFFVLFTLSFYGQQKKKDSVQKWKVHGRFAFILNQSSFSNWLAGGQNNVSGNFTINYDFNYKNNGWNWDNKLITGYGLSYLTGQGYRKTQDRIEYNSLLGLKSSQGFWFFSFFTNFITQYTAGFDYKKTPEVKVSDFFSPAYLSFGPGALWKQSDDKRFNMAPATVRFTFVNDEFSGRFGVEEGDNYSLSLGFNLSSYFKFEIMENITMENILAIYADYLDNPQNIDIDYQMNMLFKVNKYINMNLTLHFISDANASPYLQFRQIFGGGLKYSFHKKTVYKIRYF